MSTYADMIDSSRVQIVNSFDDMARWPITVGITRVELRPGRGVVVNCTDTSQWPDYHLDNSAAAGLCRYTLCVGFQINGQWVMSGFLEYWAHAGRIRTDSGAHPLETAPDGRNQFRANWAYPGRGWAPLDSFTPTPGVLMAVMLTAGDARMAKTRTVSERSQIVTVPLQLDGAWDFAPNDPTPDPIPDPTPTPTTDPLPPVPPSLTPVLIDASQFDVVIARFDSIDRQFASVRADLKQAAADLLKSLPLLKKVTGR